MKKGDDNQTTKERRNFLPLLLIAFFLLRIISWATAELWYDEVLSLQLFVLKYENIAGIFRDYCIANNHFLANAIEWLWTRLCPLALGSEFALRIPAILCGIGTLLVAYLQWRKWLGEKVAFCTGLLMAASPVFAAFAYQMRGYSLAMLLSTCAVTALMHRFEKATWRNFTALFLSSLALPLVMPSAAMLPAALVASTGLNVLTKASKTPQTLLKQLQNGFVTAAPAIAGALLGVLYYGTLWAEFQRARAESGGWESSLLVAGHLLLAFALHLSIFIWPLAKALFSKNPKAPLAGNLFWGVVISATAVLLVPSPVNRAPFPRVFLPLLPMLTFAAALTVKSSERLSAMHFKKLAILTLLPGLIIGILGDLLTARQLDTREILPQNLLQQYYRGNNPCSLNMSRLTNATQRRLILVNASDVPAFSFYWQIYGGAATNNAFDVPPYMPGNIKLQSLETVRNLHYDIAVFARTENEARSILQLQGLPQDAALSAPPVIEHRTLFTLEGR